MKIFISTLLLLTNLLSFATNYYIEIFKGNDNNVGTTPLKAWQSIDKVNNASLIPGDSVLFKRGETFRGNLIAVSGSPFGSIIYGAYGKGNKPRLLGSIQKNCQSDWEYEGANIWKTVNPPIKIVDLELIPNSGFSKDLISFHEYHNLVNGALAILLKANPPGINDSNNGGIALECKNNGHKASDIQLWIENISIKTGKFYKFSFRAKATTKFEIPDNGIIIIKNSAPYTSYSTPSIACDISTSWVNYEIYFKTLTAASDARIDFMIGNRIPNGATFYIDSLSLKEVCGDPGLIYEDVGNIIFNFGTFCGTKVKTFQELKSQGEFWYNQNDFNLKIYSSINPASFYSDIELALTRSIINEDHKCYITYENLDLMYGAACGIGGGDAHHIWIKDVNISWIGGGYLPGFKDGKVRFGNGIEFWGAAYDNIIESCKLKQIYDAALTVQGDNPTGYEAHHIYFRNNIVTSCEYSFELWGRPAQSSLHDIYFENNTCLNAGFGWGHYQRPDPNGAHLMMWGLTSKMYNVFVRNNIFSKSTNYGSRFNNLSEMNKIILDYNCWYNTSGYISFIEGKYYTTNKDLTIYKVTTGQDTHSIENDPLLNSDFTLSKKSPCIKKGIGSLTVSDDFKHIRRSKGSCCDIGAFAYQ